jgi:hypothetical protein
MEDKMVTKNPSVLFKTIALDESEVVGKCVKSLV